MGPCKNDIKLFADELILIVNAADHGSVAEDIEELEAWESIWLLQINPSKCTRKIFGGYCPLYIAPCFATNRSEDASLRRKRELLY